MQKYCFFVSLFLGTMHLVPHYDKLNKFGINAQYHEQTVECTRSIRLDYKEQSLGLATE